MSVEVPKPPPTSDTGKPDVAGPREIIRGLWPMRHKYFSVRLTVRSLVRKLKDERRK